MNDGDRRREPVNEYDAEQQEIARREGRRDVRDAVLGRGLRTSDLAGPQRGEGEASPMGFYVGEVFTIKGRRFKVAYVAGEHALTLEPLGNFRIFERRKFREMEKELNRRS
ncbi:MAG: hypothetical protein JW704_08430 [Anaerolineaceae bacterium]|nr:hypothetical protein [Anaerolineaceae bacterium]